MLQVPLFALHAQAYSFRRRFFVANYVRLSG